LVFTTGISETATSTATAKATLSSIGDWQVAGDLVVKDAGLIGSDSDKDAIAIASDGVVTFSQAPVFPDGSIDLADLDIDGGTDINAAIVDADLMIIDDGAGGTNRKTVASRLKTYIASGVVTFTADATITAAGHAGRTLLLGEVGGDADLTVTLPAATGSGAQYKFIVTVENNTGIYYIKVANASDTMTGIIYNHDDNAGVAKSVQAKDTASDTDTISIKNWGSTPTGGLVGDFVELIDVATNLYVVHGSLRGVTATPKAGWSDDAWIDSSFGSAITGAWVGWPNNPFSATVS